jgi:hypothetical protein
MRVITLRYILGIEDKAVNKSQINSSTIIAFPVYLVGKRYTNQFIIKVNLSSYQKHL